MLKQDLKTVFSTVIKNMGTTLGACGDVNRNVLAPPAPFKDRPEYVHAAKLAEDVADLLAPQSGAYYDIWLDGEKFVSAQMEVRLPLGVLLLYISKASALCDLCREHLVGALAFIRHLPINEVLRVGISSVV